MANIFQSTEIYKRLPNVQPSQNPLRAVRGMYVSGTHRAPYYIDAGCLITAVETTPATVASYTERTDTLQDPGGINILSAEITAPVITNYQAEENRMNDFTVRIHFITTTHATVSNYN